MKAIVLIDGSNLYFKLKDLQIPRLLNFKFEDFVKLLCNKDTLVTAKYYIGAVKRDGTKRMARLHSDQQRLLNYLRRAGIAYSLGYMLKSNGKYHEKGVDVNIAVDIVVAAYERLADKVILVSSDTDLIPAIRQALKKGVTIEYIGFKHQPSFALMANCSSYRLLTRQDLIPL